MKKNLFNLQNTKNIYQQLLLLFILFLSGNAWSQTSVQNFGTTAASYTSQTGSTGIIPNPTSGTTYARAGASAPAAPVAVSTGTNPLGTTGAFLKATSSSSASVTKATPILSYTSSTEFYTSFKMLCGDTNAGSTAASGVWTYYIGNQGTNYSDNTDVSSGNTFVGLRFTYGSSGALTLTYNNAGTYTSTGLTSSALSQGTVYTIEIFGNNKSTGTVGYVYNGTSQSVAVQKFDLYINGVLVGDDLTKGGLSVGTAINAMTFTGINSTSNVANLFVDDISVYNAIPVSCSSPTSPTTTGITSSTATLGWTAPTSAPANGYQYYISTSSTVPTSGTTPTGDVAVGTTVSPSLSANTTYYWWVRSNCSVSDKSSWFSGGNFITPQLAASFPYNENFEGTNANNWGFANGTQTNKWIVGTATQNGGTQSLYISNNGSANAYTISPTSASSVVYAYRDIAIPAGSTAASISFDYKLVGEGTVSIPYDYFKVWLVPTSYTPAASASTVITPLSGRIQIGGNFVNQSTYLTYNNNAVDVSSFAGQTMRLVFEWINDSSGGAQPPAAIDNLALALPSASTTVSTTSLTGFAATTASDSAQQSFIVSGVSLGSNNITITPPTGYQISTTSGSGYSSTPIILTPTSGTVANTTIYVVLKKNSTTGAVNGSITVSASPVVTPDKTISLTGAISKATFTSIVTGNWESASTWDLNAIPGTADNVVIAAAHIVTATTGQTRDNGTTTTVAGTLATNASYLNNGITTINGTFQINANGWGGGSNDFVYGSSGNLIFNHNNSSEYGSIDATHKYWPSASGPVNVTINLNSPINLGVARTVTGILQVAAGFRNLGNITIGTNGTLRLNSGYSWLNANSTPIYGTASTLVYNSGGSPGRSNEWTASSGTVGTTVGLPQNVQVSNNTTINFPNGSTNNFRANGVLTIDSGSSLYQNYSSGSAGLIVGGNLVLNGNLGLGSNEGGDITVGGNWTQAAAAVFQPNGRKAIFNGTIAQTIQKVGGGAIDFDRIEINKTNTTNVSISNSAGNLTDVNINGTSSNVLSITGSGTGSLNLQNRTLTFNNNGGFIYVDAVKAITATTGAIINVNGSKAVANNSGTGTLSFPSQVTINLNQNGVFDFGKSTDYISTVNGTVSINHTNAYVNTNPPIYATGSKLVYKSGGIYARKTEWSTTTGAGYPYDVQVTNNTTLDYPNTGSAAFNTNLGIANDLTIDNGSSLYMSYGDNGNKSGSLTIGRNLVNSGNFSLGNFAGGDLNLGGNWTSSGTFIPNDRAVAFNGNNNDQYIYSATTFDYLTVNKTSTGSLYLNANVIVNKNLTLTSKSIVLGTFNLTLPNKTSVISSNSSSYINATGTGKLIRQNLDSTSDWVFPMGVAATNRYAPITFKNLSGTTDISVNVNTLITPTVSDATRVLSTKWFVTTTNNVTANVYTEWQGIAAETNNMTIPSTGSLGITVGGAAYSFYNVNLVANNTTATAVSLANTGVNGIVIGNDNAIRIANDDCTGATNIVVDAAAVSGSNGGATNSLPAINCGGSTSSAALDVWYKFTTTDAGMYKIDATDGTINDLVLELRSGACNGTNLACSDQYSAGTESISILLDSNTTYYYRIYKFGSGTGTFTTSVSTVPSIIVAPTTLAFGDVNYNTTSDKTFTVKANFLNPVNDNISIAPLSGYEYSLDGVAYSASLSLPYTNKALAETTIHVKFHPTVACTDYNGNITISGGGAALDLAVIGRGVIETPVANAATDITTNSFIANWSSIAGVDYEVEVGTQPDIFKTNINEDFAGFTTNNGSTDRGSSLDSYLSTTGWTGSQVYEMIGYSKLGSASNKGIITTPSLDLSANGGNTTLKVDLGLFGSDANKTVQVMFAPNGSTFTQVGSVITLTSTITTYTVNITGGTANSKIRVQAVGTSNNRFYLDNFIVAQDSRIPGYNPLPVSNTSQLISGLSQETQYYYRVRAKSGSCYSAYSSIIPVITNNTIIWNNNAWTNTTGPDTTLDAIIRTPYYVKANADEFAVHNLTIENTGLLKIKSGQGITVSGDITTPDDKIIIESDASLTQTKIANGNSSNKAIAKRNVKMKTLDYTYWSSPLKDQVLLNTSNVNATNSSGGFSPGTPNNRTYEYNEVADNFKATANATFIPAKGYAIRGKSGYGTTLTVDSLAFSGNLHNGDYSIQIQKSKNTITNGVTYEHGYNLIGNPYPSNINFIKLYNLDHGDGVKNSDVIYGKAWFWTNFSASGTQAGSSYAGNNYATITLAGGTAPTSVDSAEGTPVPNEFIKVAQGFIVQMKGVPPTGTTPNTGTVKFDNSIRTNNTTGHFYNNNKNTNDDINRYWLKIVSPFNITNTILIAHMDGATNQYDADYDAELLTVGDDSFYSKVNAQKLQIQARNNPLNVDDAIALGTKYAMNGTYKISLGNREGIFAKDQKIYLRDKLTEVYTDLTAQDYSFDVSKGIDDNRFEIVYKNKEVLEVDNLTKSDFLVYKDGDYFVVKSSNALGKIELYDVTGKLVQSKNTLNKEVKFDASAMISGVYIIKAENSGNIRTKKIIK